MIIFTCIRDMPPELLEMKGIKQVAKYNLSSYYDMESLSALIPSVEFIPEHLLLDTSNPEFDIAYGNYIINNNIAFLNLMLIIIPVYLNPDCLVQILINTSEFRDVATESLMKLIQQRYGYNSYIINEPEDFIYTEEPDFSIPGLFTLDQDLNRYMCLLPPEPLE